VSPERAIYRRLAHTYQEPSGCPIHDSTIVMSGVARERPFWQARYYDFNVYTDHEFGQKMKYIHLNPVSCGLVGQSGHWSGSSFLHYSTGVAGTVEVESAWVARARELATATPTSQKRDVGHPTPDSKRLFLHCCSFHPSQLF
jgi:hypothetical protein